MNTTPINRTDLGAGSTKRLENIVSTNLFLQDIDGKNVMYVNCDFSYSIISRGYFHHAKFKKCKFTGTRFVDSNFRSATFEACDFSYADFQRCFVPVPQILANLPTYPNVRWDLLHNLRSNARSVGETRYETKLVWQEINTELEHWRLVGRSDSEYYRTKYTKLERIRAWIRYFGLRIERYLFGHGESLVRLSIATASALVVLGVINMIERLSDLQGITVQKMMDVGIDSLLFVALVFLDFPELDTQLLSETRASSVIAVILRYIVFGVAVSILYKHISKR